MRALRVRDDFRHGLGASWTVVSGDVAVVSGRLSMPTEVDTPSEIRWIEPVDLTSSMLFIKVGPDVGANTRMSMTLTADNTDALGFHVISTNPDALRLRLRQSAATSDVALDYDPLAHAWWRIREAGGRVLWDTSPNGSAWVNRRVAARTMDVGDLTLAIAADAVADASGFGTGMFGVAGFGD